MSRYGKKEVVVDFDDNSNIENRDTADSRSDGRWGRKSLRKKRSYRISTGLKQKNNSCKLSNNFPGLKTIIQSSASGSSCSCPTLTDEKVIVGQDSLDGIEINIKADGMELLHVLGTNDDKNRTQLGRRPTLPVTFTQFSTSFHPLCIPISQHRVPINTLSRVRPTSGNTKDAMSILEKYDPFDEESAIEEELKKGTAEMRALERDLEAIGTQLVRGKNKFITSRCNNPNCSSTWDIDLLLDEADFDSDKYKVVNGMQHRKSYDSDRQESDETVAPITIGWEQRRTLQTKRGYSLLASFEDPLTGENFAQKCGGSQSYQPIHTCLRNDSDYVVMKKVAANGGAVRHFAITNGSLGPSFFVSKDCGRAYQDDNLPSRLRARIKERGSDLQANAIRYLACGPSESYFAQLMCGEYLWGISQPDEEFKMVMSSFHVHRVAFGPFIANEINVETSWIVIGKGGQLAWRNIPCRLHELLSHRDESMSAPCEVSLGNEGAYFIKFMDGEIDYCLPSPIAGLCEKISEQGAYITNLVLHPELCRSFIIRHTKL